MKAQTEITSFGKYAVKGVKWFEGMECSGYNATLYRGKTKVAFVIDEGCGGEPMVRFEDKAERELYEQHLATLPPHQFEATEFSEAFAVAVDDGLFIGALIDLYENAKAEKRLVNLVKRKMKKHLYLRKPDGKVVYYKTAPTDAAIDHLMPKNPKGSVLLNRMPLAEVVEIFRNYQPPK